MKQQSSFSKLSVTSPTSQLILILQAFRHFTYVTSHSPTLPSHYLRHNSFSNPSVASPTSQLILQPFFRFYDTGSSLRSPGEPPMEIWIVRMKIKINGHSTGEQATTVSFTEIEEGVAPSRQNYQSCCAREKVNTFSVSLQNFVLSCSS